MPRTDVKLSESDIWPTDGRVWVVRSDELDSREWLRGSPVCRKLENHQIRHLAIAHMPEPFRIVRTRLGGSYFLATLEGEGRVLIDGRWVRCRPGRAMLLPPNTRQAFETAPHSLWKFCWVRYQERAGQKPLATISTPVVAEFHADPLRFAIEGLFHECRDGGLLAERWVEIIHAYVLRFALPRQTDHRLWKLWQEVADSLAHPWGIREMADRVHLSEKQLQRLCLRELGRTPRQQLIWLRMRRAAELLRSGEKIETIAHSVGYENAFAFSTTFKRIMGWSPSSYPERPASRQ